MNSMPRFGSRRIGDSEMRRPAFVPFDRDSLERIYKTNLPHWRQDGATYFVTFHLNDSLPVAALNLIQTERNQWLEKHGVAPNASEVHVRRALSESDHATYRSLVRRVSEKHLDAGYGECYLADAAVMNKVRDEMLHSDREHWHIGDFVVMPNHVHLLIVPSTMPLENCLKSIKGRSAIGCNRLLGRQGTFWQKESFDHIVRDVKQLRKFRKYIRENPVKAGIQLPKLAYHAADWMLD